MIRRKRDSGMSIMDITKEMSISRLTVRKYLNASKQPAYAKKERALKCIKSYIFDLESFNFFYLMEKNLKIYLFSYLRAVN
ncbi:MAG: helix-turn-helix domain-containing protein [Thermoplasmata archaeon]